MSTLSKSIIVFEVTMHLFSTHYCYIYMYIGTPNKRINWTSLRIFILTVMTPLLVNILPLSGLLGTHTHTHTHTLTGIQVSGQFLYLTYTVIITKCRSDYSIAKLEKTISVSRYESWDKIISTFKLYIFLFTEARNVQYNRYNIVMKTELHI